MITTVDNRIYFRPVEEADLNQKYLYWMNDPDVTRYMEIKTPVTMHDLDKYYREHSHRFDEPWFAIVLKKDSEHIGNIKLGSVNWIHRSGDISLFIGEKKYWVNGYGSEAIGLMADYAFKTLNLHKVKAGVIEQNAASLKAFEKAGFVKAGRLMKDRYVDGEYLDLIILETRLNV